MKNIRNFSIIAHIDHGKSTISDRFIQTCKGLSKREMKEQVLDSMDIERERGITIKAQSVNLSYTSRDKEVYQLNFIDTPGHIDFSYEVSRSLAACEGALLVVDASQGVEAQTISNCHIAIEQNLEIIPVINKIDLPSARPNQVCSEIESIIGIKASDAKICSAKTGLGIEDLLETIITKIPSPQGNIAAPLQALIIDSWFNPYMGVVSLVRIYNGQLSVGDRMKVMSTGKSYQVVKLGIFRPKMQNKEMLQAGEVGFVLAGIKEIHGAPVGDTLTLATSPTKEIIPKLKKTKPQVYAGLFAVSAEDYEVFREALEKLSLNDSSFFFEPEVSGSLGFGFRCGFLGMLHMEIVQERLKREYNLNIISSTPTVVYKVVLKSGKKINVDNPSKLPNSSDIREIQEPISRVFILAPKEYIGAIITLCIEKYGTQVDIRYLNHQVSIIYDIPMIEVISNFFDRLKSVSRGFASLDYELHSYKVANLELLSILINGEKIDALAAIVRREQAVYRGKNTLEQIKRFIPKQMFEVVIQAMISNNIIARVNIKAMRKDVTAKCYGGDVTRKRKLLEKQKSGKKRMKKIGGIKIPKEVFLSILRKQ